jgi:3-oxoacyl-[acyl-carrier protein] reductase
MLALQVSWKANLERTKFVAKKTIRGDENEARAKTALIKGSGQNIGRGIAHELASAGRNIIVKCSKNRDAAEYVAAEVRNLGVDSIVAMGNVIVKDEARAFIDDSVAAFGSPDILVNNVAIRPHDPFLEIT